MRTTKELLKLVKDLYTKNDCFLGTLEHLSKYGLCAIVLELETRCLVNSEEASFLRDYIRKNTPVKTFYCYDGEITDDKDQFWYPMGEVAPRLEWLDKHIDLNQNEKSQET